MDDDTAGGAEVKVERTAAGFIVECVAVDHSSCFAEEVYVFAEAEADLQTG